VAVWARITTTATTTTTTTPVMVIGCDHAQAAGGGAKDQ